jgi:hypothetical protein
MELKDVVVPAGGVLTLSVLGMLAGISIVANRREKVKQAKEKEAESK